PTVSTASPPPPQVPTRSSGTWIPGTPVPTGRCTVPCTSTVVSPCTATRACPPSPRPRVVLVSVWRPWTGCGRADTWTSTPPSSSGSTCPARSQAWQQGGHQDHSDRGDQGGHRQYPGQTRSIPGTGHAVPGGRSHHHAEQQQFGDQHAAVTGVGQGSPGHPRAPGEGDPGDQLHRQEERCGEDPETAAHPGEDGGALLTVQGALGQGQHPERDGELRPGAHQGRAAGQESLGGPAGVLQQRSPTPQGPWAPASARRRSWSANG